MLLGIFYIMKTKPIFQKFHLHVFHTKREKQYLFPNTLKNVTPSNIITQNEYPTRKISWGQRSVGIFILVCVLIDIILQLKLYKVVKKCTTQGTMMMLVNERIKKDHHPWCHHYEGQSIAVKQMLLKKQRSMI